ncbi:MAG: sn-glycerol-3-phosphate ABC transporter ATP-binding protein UgpC [Rhodocyclaceae bacterium]
MGSVVLKNVYKSFGKTDVIRDVSIDIPDGEFCVLVGPSGCGKSTLLRIIAGLEEVTGGAVHIANKDVTHLEPKERDIAMVFQSYALYPQMTVRENMGFALKLAKVPKDEIARKVDDVTKMLGLENLLERLPKALSGGQRQRVAMGRAIVRSPQVFLFDEPLSNLDAKLRTQVRAEIRELHQRLGTTSVYVTHDQIEAMTMGQKIVVLRDGRVEQMGSPLDLYDRPANVFVAGFIGSPTINLLDGKIVRRDTGLYVQLPGGETLPVPHSAQVTEGQEVVFGIRPEQVRICQEGEHSVPATVTSVENTGSDMQVFCETSGGRMTTAFKDRVNVVAGDQIRLGADLTGIHLFDRASGMRVAGI